MVWQLGVCLALVPQQRVSKVATTVALAAEQLVPTPAGADVAAVAEKAALAAALGVGAVIAVAPVPVLDAVQPILALPVLRFAQVLAESAVDVLALAVAEAAVEPAVGLAVVYSLAAVTLVAIVGSVLQRLCRHWTLTTSPWKFQTIYVHRSCHRWTANPTKLAHDSCHRPKRSLYLRWLLPRTMSAYFACLRSTLPTNHSTSRTISVRHRLHPSASIPANYANPCHR